MKPRRRGVRRPSIALAIGERDRALLACIAAVRYLSANQLASEFFPSPDRCRRRLRQLYDAGLVAVTLAGSNQANLVSITAEGLRVVGQTNPELAARCRLPGTLRLAGIAHHLGVVDARLYLLALANAGGPAVLRWTNAPSDATPGVVGSPKLIPDGLAELAAAHGTLRLAIEFDAGSEVLSTLRAKLTRYRVAMDSGDIDELWVVVATTGLRCAHIAALATEVGIAEFTRVMPQAHLVQRPAVAPLARVSAAQGDRVPTLMPQSQSNHLTFNGVSTSHPTRVGGTDGGAVR